jgi:adenylate kinase family enzyme
VAAPRAHTVPVQRISVVGNSGSGKTTLARRLAAALAVPHLELDAVFHQPGWQPLDRDLFKERVTAFTAGPAWVVDGNYGAVRDIVWARADTVIWLDPPRSRVMRQVVSRTLRRMATRAELWNGNKEPWTNLFRLDPQENIISWAWTSHHKYRERYAAAMADPAYGHLAFIRVRRMRDAADLIRVARAPAQQDPGPADR